MLTKIMNYLLDVFASKQWTPVVGADGVMMRRRAKGRWEIRPASVNEVNEAAYNQAIK